MVNATTGSSPSRLGVAYRYRGELHLSTLPSTHSGVVNLTTARRRSSGSTSIAGLCVRSVLDDLGPRGRRPLSSRSNGLKGLEPRYGFALAHGSQGRNARPVHFLWASLSALPVVDRLPGRPQQQSGVCSGQAEPAPVGGESLRAEPLGGSGCDRLRGCARPECRPAHLPQGQFEFLHTALECSDFGAVVGRGRLEGLDLGADSCSGRQ